MATMCLNLHLNTRRSANVAGLEPGGGLCSCTEYAYRERYFLSSDVCNIVLYLQLYFCCFSNVQAEKSVANLFCNGNNMSLQSITAAEDKKDHQNGFSFYCFYSQMNV